MKTYPSAPLKVIEEITEADNKKENSYLFPIYTTLVYQNLVFSSVSMVEEFLTDDKITFIHYN